MIVLYVLGFFFLLFLVVFVDLLLFGSDVDPDDNGMARSSSQKEKFKQIKLKRRE